MQLTLDLLISDFHPAVTPLQIKRDDHFICAGSLKVQNIKNIAGYIRKDKR